MLPKFFYAFTLTLAILPVLTVPAGAATVIITKADCAALVRHVAEPGVAYEPGIDVNGRPVVAADLGDTPEIKLPEEIAIAITVDIDKRFNIPPAQAPHCAHLRNGTKMGDLKFQDTMITDGLICAINGYHMGNTAENVAKKWQLTRDDQDAFAAGSQQKAEAAQKAGHDGKGCGWRCGFLATDSHRPARVLTRHAR